MNYKKLTAIAIFLLVAVLMNSCNNNTVTGPNTWNSLSPLASSIDASTAYDWISVTYRIASDQQPNPPKVSRIYSYIAVAIYESVAPGIPYSRSMSGQIRDMPQMPAISPDSVYDWPSVVNASACGVIRVIFDTLYPPLVTVVNTTYTNEYNARVAAVGQQIVDRSIRHGNDIANAIIQWSHTDMYHETRSMHYTLPPRDAENPWAWLPINPGDVPVEPFWKLIKPFALEQPDMFTTELAIPCDSVPGGPFYNEASEINQIGINLTTEQQDIATFWNDKLRTGTPSGHWFSIATQVMQQKNFKLDKVAQTYVMLGIAGRDAFIACWKEKYKKNLVRPEDYIRHYINPNFYPYIQTPSFPEYASGHSTVSGASSEALTRMIGDNIGFTDRTHIPINLSARTFTSFYAAATEAGFSRMYGGIHFRSANLNGVAMGKLIGGYAYSKIKFYFYQ